MPASPPLLPAVIPGHSRATGCARLAWCAILLLLAAWSSAQAARIAEREKTDVVTLKNGDRLTGRIISAQYGILQLSSRGAGAVSIEWPSIQSISSKYMFRVEQVGGLHYEGLIYTTQGEFHVNTSTGEVTIPLEHVTQILPYESNFWERVYGDISFGYSYAKISGVGQTSFEFDANYTDAALEATLNASVLATQDSSGTSTNQDDISSTVFFSRPHNNFWGYIGDLQRNRSLGVNGRAVAGAVIGHRVLETDTTRVLGYVGVVYDQEWAAGTDSGQSSLEGALGGTWRVFQFNYPKVTLDSDLIVYPSITLSPRYRVSGDMTLTTKISSRFAIKLSAYLNYDSKPPDPTATTTDYGVVTSLAYQFGSVVQ
jgi:hypothetical protein